MLIWRVNVLNVNMDVSLYGSPIWRLTLIKLYAISKRTEDDWGDIVYTRSLVS